MAHVLTKRNSPPLGRNRKTCVHAKRKPTHEQNSVYRKSWQRSQQTVPNRIHTTKEYKITAKKPTTTNPTNSKRLYYVWQTIDQKVSGACNEQRERKQTKFLNIPPKKKHTKRRKSETSATSGGGYSFLIDFFWFLSTPTGAIRRWRNERFGWVSTPRQTSAAASPEPSELRCKYLTHAFIYRVSFLRTEHTQNFSTQDFSRREIYF